MCRRVQTNKDIMPPAPKKKHSWPTFMQPALGHENTGPKIGAAADEGLIFYNEMCLFPKSLAA